MILKSGLWLMSLASAISAFALICSNGYERHRLEKYSFKQLDRWEASQEAALGRMGFKVSFKERIYQRYWIAAGFDQKFKGVPRGSLWGLSLLFGSGLAYGAIEAYENYLVGVSGLLVGMVLPFEFIGLYIVYQEHQTIRQLPMLFGVLLRWAHINEDPMYCLSKLSESGLPKRITSPYTQFCMAYQTGTSLKSAQRQLEAQSNLKIMKYFSLCLEQLLRQRGDVIKLFGAFEEEAYQLQQEELKRKMTRIHYKLLINGLCLSSFFIMHGLLKTNRVLSGFYIESTWGQCLLGIISLLGAGVFISGFKYDRSEVF